MTANLKERVLLTAFEPFGMSGTNRSKEVCDRVSQLFDHSQIQYIVLHVSAAGIQGLAAVLRQQPKAVVMTGENGLQIAPVVIEARAFNPKLQLLGLGLPFRQAQTAPYAQAVSERVSGDNVKLGQSNALLNGYYCNTANWEGINWSKETGRPSVFLHLSKIRSMDTQVEAVTKVVRAMQEQTQ